MVSFNLLEDYFVTLRFGSGLCNVLSMCWGNKNNMIKEYLSSIKKITLWLALTGIAICFSACNNVTEKSSDSQFGFQVYPGADTNSRLTCISSFENCLIAGNENGQILFLKQVSEDRFKLVKSLDVNRINASQDNKVHLYHVFVQRKGSDTIVWAGVRNNALQRAILNGHSDSRFIDFKMVNKEYAYSPYHFIPSDSSELFVATSNGLYNTSTVDSTLKLVFHKDEIKNEPPEFRVFNLVEFNKKYYASSLEGLISFTKTEGRIIANQEVYSLNTNSNKVLAFCNKKRTHDLIDIEFQYINEKPDCIFVDSNRVWHFYSGRTVYYDGKEAITLKNQISNVRNAMCKHGDKLYTIDGGSIKRVLRFEIFSNGLPLKTITTDNITGKTYLLSHDNNLYELSNNGQKAIKIADISSLNDITSLYAYNNEFFVLTQSNIYNFSKYNTFMHWIRPRLLIEMEKEIIKSSVQYHNNIIIGLRNGVRSFDMNRMQITDTLINENLHVEGLKIKTDSLLVYYLFGVKKTGLRAVALSKVSKVSVTGSNGSLIKDVRISNQTIMLNSDTLVKEINVNTHSLKAFYPAEHKLFVAGAGNRGCFDIDTNTRSVKVLEFDDQNRFYFRLASLISILLLAVLFVFRRAINKYRVKRQSKAIAKRLDERLLFFRDSSIEKKVEEKIAELKNCNTLRSLEPVAEFLTYIDAESRIIEYLKKLINVLESKLKELTDADQYRKDQNFVLVNDSEILKIYINGLYNKIAACEEKRYAELFNNIQLQISYFKNMEPEESKIRLQQSTDLCSKQADIEELRTLYKENEQFITLYKSLNNEIINLKCDLKQLYGDDPKQHLSMISGTFLTLNDMQSALKKAGGFIESLRAKPLSGKQTTSILVKFEERLNKITDVHDIEILIELINKLKQPDTHGYEFLKLAGIINNELNLASLLDDIFLTFQGSNIDARKIQSLTEDFAKNLSDTDKDLFPSTKNDVFRIIVILLSTGSYNAIQSERLSLALGKCLLETKTAESRRSDAKKLIRRITKFESLILSRRFQKLRASMQRNNNHNLK